MPNMYMLKQNKEELKSDEVKKKKNVRSEREKEKNRCN